MARCAAQESKPKHGNYPKQGQIKRGHVMTPNLLTYTQVDPHPPSPSPPPPALPFRLNRLYKFEGEASEYVSALSRRPIVSAVLNTSGSLRSQESSSSCRPAVSTGIMPAEAFMS